MARSILERRRLALAAVLPVVLALAPGCSGEIGSVEDVSATDGSEDEGSGAGASPAGGESGQGGAGAGAGPGSGGHGAASGTGGNGGAGAGSGAGGAGTGAGGPGGGGGAGGGAGAGGAGGSGGAGPCTGGPKPQDPTCYWEPVCPDAPLDDLAASYSPAKWLSTALEMTARRYPSASCLIDLYQNDVGNYAETGSFGALSESMMTMVHEETHGYDYEHADWGSTFAYYVRCDYAAKPPFLDGFPRSEILPHVEGNATSLYDSTYLEGQQGTYGWVELLDEWNAYLNGMAAIGLMGDYVPAFGISGTDGALAFAYYVELYLRVARTEHPQTYQAIQGSAAFKDLLRLQWNRMHFFLELAQKYDNLSIHAGAIEKSLYAPENLEELEMVLGIELDPSPCN